MNDRLFLSRLVFLSIALWLTWYQSLVPRRSSSFFILRHFYSFGSPPLCLGWPWSKWPTSDQNPGSQKSPWWWSTAPKRIFEDFYGFFLHQIRCHLLLLHLTTLAIFLQNVFIFTVQFSGFFSKSDHTWTRGHTFSIFQDDVFWSVIGSSCGAHVSLHQSCSRSPGVFFCSWFGNFCNSSSWLG